MTSRVDWREGGIGTPKRKYLRVTREDMAFDICAAPFGTGFFFSWWLGTTGSGFIHWVIVILPSLAFLQFVQSRDAGHDLLGFLAFFILLSPFLRLVALVSRKYGPGVDDAVGRIPVIGFLYRALFTRITYHRIDTMLMFQSVVQSAVCEVIDGLTKAKGLRVLGDDEKKPIMRDLFKR
ncbi:MAG: hypothetical protein KJ831_09145 [Candidatus Eisenbacteria bacterium]|nr:hypothetical protein [Candidatus Eisenbacteria bacterium]